jgi:hypothetical protein
VCRINEGVFCYAGTLPLMNSGTFQTFQIYMVILRYILSTSLFYLLVHSRCRGLWACDHTRTHTTVGTTPLDEGSARRRDLYLTTQTLYKTNIHAPGGIRTRNPSKRSAADPRLRPRGHCDMMIQIPLPCKLKQMSHFCVQTKPDNIILEVTRSYVYAKY